MLGFRSKTSFRGILLWSRDTRKTILPCFRIARHFSASDSTKDRSFTISYLINSCGISEEKAISVSKGVHFETSTNPDSVLTFLRNNGFPDSHITNIIEQFPRLLVSKVKQTIQPKFDFFNSKGLSGPDLAKVLVGHPAVMRDSLEKKLIPTVAILKSIVHTDEKVLTLLKRSLQFLSKNPQKLLIPNITLLRAHGVPDSNITKLLVTQPRALQKTPKNFNEIVEQVKEMGFDPSQYLFVLALHVLSSMSKSTLEAKFDIYRRWGWSKDDIHCAFRKQPYCMAASEKKITLLMDYLVNKMGYDSLLIAKRPGILLFSPERTIIPRCSVIQVLSENGLIEKDINIASFINLSEKDFLKRFVTKFEEKVPDLLKVYQGRGS